MAKAVSLRDFEDTSSLVGVVAAQAPMTWREAACQYIDRCLDNLSGRLHRERSFDQDDTCRGILALRGLRSTICESDVFDIEPPPAVASLPRGPIRLARILVPPKHKTAIVEGLRTAAGVAEEAAIDAGPGEVRRQHLALVHEIDAFVRFLEQVELDATSAHAAAMRAPLVASGGGR